ncbi:MAG TPA: hypothetical protein EYN38_01840 [Flavobacteriales bacterium]|nr:hypothetical protein [Flavobacteriales bacterium]HIO71827.1 hypothetical protein [Flavobacteriales bacterium]
MRHSEIRKTLLIVGALAVSISVFGQGRGDGRGNGQGRSGQHRGNTEQKMKYRNVNAIQIFSAEGTELYDSAKKPPKSKEPVAKIDRVETNQYGVRIYFMPADPNQRVIDMKCKNCLILVDYMKAGNAAATD